MRIVPFAVNGSDVITFKLSVVTERVNASAGGGASGQGDRVISSKDQISIPSNVLGETELVNRTVNGVTKVGAEVNVPGTVDFSNLLGRLTEGSGAKEELTNSLRDFVGVFLPTLQARLKHKQLIAELENLEHMKSCADEMLNGNGLNFKPEFVAMVIARRLRIAAFNPESTVLQRYRSLSTFDFGNDRTNPRMTGRYGSVGVATSPGRDGRRGNAFGYIRPHSGEFVEEPYVMPDDGVTACLSERFRRYLESVFANGGTWKAFGPTTKFLDLPHGMMFIVGLQFGQINVGTWNPFMVAAKRYFAFQTTGSNENTFFWRQAVEGKEPAYGPPGNYAFNDRMAMLRAAFGGLRSALGIAGSEEQQFVGDCETALCAYYAINQEILSRTEVFEETEKSVNDRRSCAVKKIFRLEGLESLVPMGIVYGGENNGAFASDKAVSSVAKRPVIASTSAGMFVSSLDKPKVFPPPISAITLYDNVHHARIFGCHLFNVDFANANRELPGILKNGTSRTQYTSGSPFFKDEQREFLLMPKGLVATVIGTLAWAQGQSCTVVSDDSFKENLIDGNKFVKLTAQGGGFEPVEDGKGGIKTGSEHCNLVKFCLGKVNALDDVTKLYVGQANRGSNVELKIAGLSKLFSPGKCPSRNGEESGDAYKNRLEAAIKDRANPRDLLLKLYMDQLGAFGFGNVFALK